GKKISEYLRGGTPLVLIIDPEERTVSKWAQSSAPITLNDDETLDLGEVVDGFRCEVRDIFD
ncbi:MAG TPA: hypothetical protein VD867_04345, partial [Burkholderiales bacterium]|nr:hypothetical protein [Burkholderiales bacterium]